MGTSEKPPRIHSPPDTCGLATVLQSVAGKWALMAIGALCEEPLRFNALRRTIGSVSQKSLTQTLRSLERDGLIRREVIPTVPVSVVYSLTPLGNELAQCSEPLRVWSERSEATILASRQAYDR